MMGLNMACFIFEAIQMLAGAMFAGDIIYLAQNE